MNEPKRRGRPPKAKLLQPINARVEGADAPKCPECGWVVGHYDDCPVGMGVKPADMDRVTLASIEAALEKVWTDSAAQIYAERVWNGQNTDLPRNERLDRVRRALDGQGLSMEGVVL